MKKITLLTRILVSFTDNLD